MKYFMIVLGLVVSGCPSSKCVENDSRDAICTKACYPNPVDRVYGKQCFCKADIVIREMPNEEVPGNR